MEFHVPHVSVPVQRKTMLKLATKIREITLYVSVVMVTLDQDVRDVAMVSTRILTAIKVC